MEPKPSLEHRIAEIVRSKTAGWIGLAFGLAAAVLLVFALSDQVTKGRTLFEEQTAWSLIIALIGFALFQFSCMVSLSILLGQPATHLWAASQLAKYFPAPGASLGGMMHSSLRSGLTTREALALTLRHSGILLGTAMAVGAWSVGEIARTKSSVPFWVAFFGMLVVAAGVLVASTRKIEAARAWATIIACAFGWAVLGVFLWLGIARGHSGGPVIVTAFSAAWAIGFIVLPVPAGIGIRETALVFLLKPWLGQGGAVSFAVLSRLVQIGSDGVLVAGDVILRRRRPASTQKVEERT